MDKLQADTLIREIPIVSKQLNLSNPEENEANKNDWIYARWLCHLPGAKYEESPTKSLFERISEVASSSPVTVADSIEALKLRVINCLKRHEDPANNFCAEDCNQRPKNAACGHHEIELRPWTSAHLWLQEQLGLIDGLQNLSAQTDFSLAQSQLYVMDRAATAAYQPGCRDLYRAEYKKVLAEARKRRRRRNKSEREIVLHEVGNSERKNGKVISDICQQLSDNYTKHIAI